MTYTTQNKLDEVLREIKFREKVYTRLVNTGSGGYTQELATKRINIMKEIAEDYQKAAKAERLL